MQISNITLCEFEQAFNDAGRSNQFSFEGLKTLFNMLEVFEDSTGEQIELDVIALCCEFTEYQSLEELQNSYDSIKSEECLSDHTFFGKTDSGGYVIQDF